MDVANRVFHTWISTELRPSRKFYKTTKGGGFIFEISASFVRALLQIYLCVCAAEMLVRVHRAAHLHDKLYRFENSLPCIRSAPCNTAAPSTLYAGHVIWIWNSAAFIVCIPCVHLRSTLGGHSARPNTLWLLHLVAWRSGINTPQTPHACMGRVCCRGLQSGVVQVSPFGY